MQANFTNQRPQFDIIYDQYSGLLYGIILKLSQNQAESERILVRSFTQYFSHKFQAGDKLIFAKLLKIAIPMVSEQIVLSKEEISKILLTNLRRPATTNIASL